MHGINAQQMTFIMNYEITATFGSESLSIWICKRFIISNYYFEL